MVSSLGLREFEPLIPSGHALTVLCHFWPRDYDFAPYPMERSLVRTDPDTQVLVLTQRPVGRARAEVVLLHGLEGGGDSGYNVSMAFHALEAGYIVHRFHMRTCGGTERLCKTLYHAGLTSDLLEFLRRNAAQGRGLPVFLVGFSLGGNVGLKLAGELGETELIRGVCSVSTPIDLAASARAIGGATNALYERRFVDRMKKRLISTGRHTQAELGGCWSIYEIDDRVTAPSFGFGTADNYYATQSAMNFLDRIRVPALSIQAKDDPLVPFDMYGHPAYRTNPNLRLLACEHGGHVAFLARRGQRFWVDEAVLDFVARQID